MSTLLAPSMASNSPPRPDGLAQPLASNIGKKKRGGRQLRQVALSADLKFAIRQFAIQVGTPRLMEPTGFRDFRGWLERVSGTSTANSWASLIDAMIEETAGDAYKIMLIKEEVVRDIVRAIVVPRPGESAKLVSTNCGRQCARPRSGNTLMTILERILVEKGIVTAHEIELFMSERMSPPTSMYRELSSPMTAAVPGPSSRHSSPGGLRAMSLQTITASPEPHLQHAMPYAYGDAQFQRAPPVQGAGSYEYGYQMQQREQEVHHGYASAGLQTRGPDLVVTTAAMAPPLNPIQGAQSGPEGRLPSFQELEESLDKAKS